MSAVADRLAFNHDPLDQRFTLCPGLTLNCTRMGALHLFAGHSSVLRGRLGAFGTAVGGSAPMVVRFFNGAPSMGQAAEDGGVNGPVLQAEALVVIEVDAVHLYREDGSSQQLEVVGDLVLIGGLYYAGFEIALQ